LENKGINQAFGCFLCPTRMLLGEIEGTLPFVGGRYKVESGKVKFFFDDDPNLGYEHDQKELERYLRDTFVETENGGIYSIELMQMRGDTMYFKMTNVTEVFFSSKQ
jgi:hypothetical protein